MKLKIPIGFLEGDGVDLNLKVCIIYLFFAITLGDLKRRWVTRLTARSGPAGPSGGDLKFKYGIKKRRWVT